MLIRNPEAIPAEKQFACNGLIAKYLIYEAHLPLLAKDGRTYIFYKNQYLLDAIENMPFYLKIGLIF